MSLPSPKLNSKGQTVNDATGNQPTEYFPLPSQKVNPTKVGTLPQQGSTMPGDGKEIREDGTEHIPFKERVIGVAQVTRGTILGNQELKEHGVQILDGVTTHEKDKQQ